jgi:hypothetical protein
MPSAAIPKRPDMADYIISGKTFPVNMKSRILLKKRQQDDMIQSNGQ